jgi:alpha-N-acetylglucosamine transferase
LLFPEIIERREAISLTEISETPPTNLPISSTSLPISSKNGEFPSTNLPISSTASLNLPCTSKNYHRLSTELGKLNSVEKISNFLIEETKSRKCDRKKSLTKKLDQSDWRSLREEVKKRIENSKNEKKFVKNLRQKITFWILFPNLKGDKPENWNKILEILIKS